MKDQATPADPNPMRQAMRNLIANDAYAASFQSMGQYRAALLQHFDTLLAPRTGMDADQQDSAQVAALAQGRSSQ